MKRLFCKAYQTWGDYFFKVATGLLVIMYSGLIDQFILYHFVSLQRRKFSESIYVLNCTVK